jgi:hypothetical protein
MRARRDLTPITASFHASSPDGGAAWTSADKLKTFPDFFNRAKLMIRYGARIPKCIAMNARSQKSLEIWVMAGAGSL